MANEITASASLRAKKGSVDKSLSVGPVSFTMTGTQYTSFVKNVGTSEESLNVIDAAYGGWLLMVNIDTTNYVEWYTGTGGTVTGKMEPGEWAMFRSASTADLYLKANTAACDVEIFMVDD